MDWSLYDNFESNPIYFYPELGTILNYVDVYTVHLYRMDSYYFVRLLLTYFCISHALSLHDFSPFAIRFHAVSRRCRYRCVLLFSGVIVVVFVVILVVIADIF